MAEALMSVSNTSGGSGGSIDGDALIDFILERSITREQIILPNTETITTPSEYYPSEFIPYDNIRRASYVIEYTSDDDAWGFRSVEKNGSCYGGFFAVDGELSPVTLLGDCSARTIVDATNKVAFKVEEGILYYQYELNYYSGTEYWTIAAGAKLPVFISSTVF